MITWATQFKNIIKLNKDEKTLTPNATVTFCRPPTLANHLLNYKEVCRPDNKKQKGGRSKGCGRCGLCGNWGELQNMTKETNTIKRKDGKEFSLKQDLNCKNYGIYVAECKKCQEHYVGQTKQTFSRRWNLHRHNWNKMLNANKDNREKKEEETDEQALFLHYVKKHKNELQSGLKLTKAYSVIFAQEPKYRDLDISENSWIGKLRSKINIAKTFLPKYR